MLLNIKAVIKFYNQESQRRLTSQHKPLKPKKSLSEPCCCNNEVLLLQPHQSTFIFKSLLRGWEEETTAGKLETSSWWLVTCLCGAGGTHRDSMPGKGWGTPRRCTSGSRRARAAVSARWTGTGTLAGCLGGNIVTFKQDGWNHLHYTWNVSLSKLNCTFPPLIEFKYLYTALQYTNTSPTCEEKFSS